MIMPATGSAIFVEMSVPLSHISILTDVMWTVTSAASFALCLHTFIPILAMANVTFAVQKEWPSLMTLKMLVTLIVAIAVLSAI